MLFGKKNKFHASARFQRRDFSKRVNAARNYKRAVRKRPETKLQAFLENIGLGAKLSQVGVAAAILILVYLTFIPNFLFVNNIEIKGAGPEITAGVETRINDYFKSGKGFWPQRNIIFLNKAALVAYLTKYDPAVLKVNSIKKRLWNQLSLEVSPRVEKFLLITTANKYVIYNDGVVARQLGTEEKIPDGLFRLQVSRDDEIKSGDVFFPNQLAEQLQELADNFKNVTGKPIDFLEIATKIKTPKSSESTLQPTQESDSLLQTPVNEKEELNLNQLTLFVKRDSNSKDSKTDFRVYIDPEVGSIAETEDRAKLMFTQLPPDRFAALYYLDLRFKDKAYVCLRNSACAQSSLPPVVAPVPTPAPAEATKPKN